ncbi:uncharacterized protein [Parasteatoda tepidariorum]|uniref:uncharacterized protein n=1 Tax=Parasteatoda tepidariorum TaxID=114398 RepID=UPI00077F8371|nr:uncharacterized protein LOC107451401 [Parasteatoda tepidariorum]XP_015922972.1 uncharacterized protein LOC107451401 [Parasteatoda tepidariorum]
MVSLRLTITICVLSLAIFITAEPMPIDKIKLRVQKLCDENNDDLIKELALCYKQFASTMNQRVARTCIKRLAPETYGDLFAFVKTVCKDLSLVDAVMACFHTHDQKFDKVKDKNGAKACVLSSLSKHDAFHILFIKDEKE